ncbi:MAG: hypothetical protein ACYC7J_16550 [Syntrophales bacterium]
MNAVLKRVAIAAVLIVVGGVIFALTKRYGVWVITGIAVVLFFLGLLRRDEAKKGGDNVPEDTNTGSGKTGEGFGAAREAAGAKKITERGEADLRGQTEPPPSGEMP